MKVFIVTDPELGWDCIVGVFTSMEAIYQSWIFDDVEVGTTVSHRDFDNMGLIIHEQEVEGKII